MQKYHKKHDKVHYINKNYVLKPIYNDKNECTNDTLSVSNVDIFKESLMMLSGRMQGQRY